MTYARQAINHIQFMVDTNGNRIEGQKDIQAHCVNYLSSLLGGYEEPPQFDPADISNLLSFRCSYTHQDILASDFSTEEIKAAAFSLPRNKAFGPDGYTAEFFKSCWHIIGPEVVEVVREFFRSGQLLQQWNATTIVLIPKVPNAASTADFRPISLCNTMYKVISMLLAGRLQAILPLAISNAQSAFLPDRLLTENVLLATELVNGYSRKNIGPRGMLKVDLRKAFDSLKWDFIIAAMQALHFPGRFINWIRQCISTPSFSVSVSGSTSGLFKSSKGLRQRDPISPYLFAIAMEVFSGLMRTSFVAGFIQHHPKTKERDITHLMFTDDVMVFFDGSSSSLQGISDVMDLFASWSGFRMNYEKTQIFTAGLEPSESLAISNSGFTTGSLPIRYLGLPLMSSKLRISEYSPLLDKLMKRFHAWASLSLSRASRRWSHFVADFSDLALWTVARELRLHGIGSMWVAWHHFHHIKGRSFWSIKTSATDSWNWKSLLAVRPLAEPFVKCVLGNGQNASFWYDVWSPFGMLIKTVGADGPARFGIPPQATEHQLHSYLDSLPPPRSDVGKDCFKWNIQRQQFTTFPTAKTWDCIRERTTTKDWASSIWFKGATPKHAFTMWVAQLQRLPTRDRLHSWGISTPTTCCLCSSYVESHTHLILHCLFSDQVWMRVHSHLMLRPIGFHTWPSFLAWTRLRTDSAPPILRKLACQAVVYHLWKLRNNIIHNQVQLSPAAVFKEIDVNFRNTITARESQKQFKSLMGLWIK
ncbi:PREDICTED: uncharacterized protein LOC104720343 [Camelina sativa]|uniref:Uncharacterized protein LOC104720343 n=1 Tax=Camelina sativa TaxID=90675 RepID=A0ABM0U6C6_CAMSA|nr:PREDICTED: uncharacterized protein LOC104720343 [Camelina sativa]